MQVLQGKFNSAKVFSDNIEEEATKQIIELLSQEVFRDSKIRIMPDAHTGKGCVIGFTGNLGDKVIPNLVGVDIGCGMIAVKLGRIKIDFADLDHFIRRQIPHGGSVNKTMPQRVDKAFMDKIADISLKLKGDLKRFQLSIGSLGSGNHFIEINEDSEKNKWLVVHSGSRNFGLQIANYHQKAALKYIEGKSAAYRNKVFEALRELRIKGESPDIRERINKYEEKLRLYSVPKDLAYLEGALKDEYLDDMRFAQQYAWLNREVMASRILEYFGLKLEELEHFQTVHNYIDFEDNIIRKGAISAKKGEKLLIPINMRDGSMIAIGKGNEDWNCSAPHGAGRLMSRTKAKKTLSLEDFQETMKHVWTTSVNRHTLDEAPMAYKPIEEILSEIDETIQVIEIMKPIYNFKA